MHLILILIPHLNRHNLTLMYWNQMCVCVIEAVLRSAWNVWLSAVDLTNRKQQEVTGNHKEIHTIISSGHVQRSEETSEPWWALNQALKTWFDYDTARLSFITSIRVSSEVTWSRGSQENMEYCREYELYCQFWRAVEMRSFTFIAKEEVNNLRNLKRLL